MSEISISGHFSLRRTAAEEIVSGLEVKLRAIMDNNPGKDVDVVELGLWDADSKYSREDVKRMARKLVREIAGNAIVGKIVEEVIEYLGPGDGDVNVKPEAPVRIPPTAAISGPSAGGIKTGRAIVGPGPSVGELRPSVALVS